MKYLILAIALLSVGCSPTVEAPKVIKGAPNSATYYCINSVSYIFFYHSMTVLLDKNSKIIPCEEK